MTIAEQLAALEATRAEKQARMGAIGQKSMDENRSMDTAEGAEFDTLQPEIKQVDADLVRFRSLERIAAAASCLRRLACRACARPGNDNHARRTGR